MHASWGPSTALHPSPCRSAPSRCLSGGGYAARCHLTLRTASHVCRAYICTVFHAYTHASPGSGTGCHCLLLAYAAIAATTMAASCPGGVGVCSPNSTGMPPAGWQVCVLLTRCTWYTVPAWMRRMTDAHICVAVTCAAPTFFGSYTNMCCRLAHITTSTHTPLDFIATIMYWHSHPPAFAAVRMARATSTVAASLRAPPLRACGSSHAAKAGGRAHGCPPGPLDPSRLGGL